MTTGLFGVAVCWDTAAPGTEVDMLKPTWVNGVLTTEHPQSCYDAPVLVGEDGSAYGPGDLPAHVQLHSRHGQFHHRGPWDDRLRQTHRELHGEESAAEHEEIGRLVNAALAAGFRLAL